MDLRERGAWVWTYFIISKYFLGHIIQCKNNWAFPKNCFFRFLSFQFNRLDQTKSIKFLLKTRADHLRKLSQGRSHVVSGHVSMTYAGEFDICLQSGVSFPGTTAKTFVQYTFYAPLGMLEKSGLPDRLLRYFRHLEGTKLLIWNWNGG